MEKEKAKEQGSDLLPNQQEDIDKILQCNVPVPNLAKAKAKERRAKEVVSQADPELVPKKAFVVLLKTACILLKLPKKTTEENHVLAKKNNLGTCRTFLGSAQIDSWRSACREHDR